MQTVAVVGYAAAGIAGGLLAAFVAFTPSFVFVLARRAATSTASATTARARAFLDGAGPAAIGAIIGVAIPLALALARSLAVRDPRRGASSRCSRSDAPSSSRSSAPASSA